MVNETQILSFGEEAAGSSSLFVAEIDEAMHQEGAGAVKSSFLPGEAVYVLLHHDPALKIVRLRDTAGGDLQRIGTVSRSRTVEVTFTHPDDRHELPHRPSGLPSARWYGRTSPLGLAGRALRAPGAPCLGEVTYSFTAVQYRYRPPGGMELAVGEQWPVDLVIETEG